jgi:hypothetical protein
VVGGFFLRGEESGRDVDLKDPATVLPIYAFVTRTGKNLRFKFYTLITRQEQHVSASEVSRRQCGSLCGTVENKTTLFSILLADLCSVVVHLLQRNADIAYDSNISVLKQAQVWQEAYMKIKNSYKILIKKLEKLT